MATYYMMIRVPKDMTCFSGNVKGPLLAADVDLCICAGWADRLLEVDGDLEHAFITPSRKHIAQMQSVAEALNDKYPQFVYQVITVRIP